MNSRKRHLSSPTAALVKSKHRKEETKENNLDESSNDSFESFSAGVITKPSDKKTSPRSRSTRILAEDKEEDDSFDSPVVDLTPQKQKLVAKSSKKESGVEGFPCLYDNDQVVYLTIVTVSRREGSLDLECKEKTGTTRMVYLQDRWSELPVEEGNAINLIAPKIWDDDDYIVDDEQGIVILNPNALVPCTSIASANYCMRKTVLNDRFKFGNSSNKAMLLGTIMHEIFQTALNRNKRPLNDQDLLAIWKSQAPKYAEELVALSFTPNCLDSELHPYLSVVCDWINKHYPVTSTLFGKREPLPSKSELLEVHDIEENIWDTKLGLKGKVDVTMQTKQHKGIESLELKTGKSHASSDHTAQVLLYCMMHSSRYEQPVGFGNILYLKDGVSRVVIPRAAELLGILQQRNNLSVFFEDPTLDQLPPPRQDSRFCVKCDHKVMCSFYQITKENFVKSSEAQKTFAESEMKHLEQSHIDYASNWINWIIAEWKCERKRMETHTEDLWLKTVQEREAEGTCMANLSLVSEEVANSQKVLILFGRSPCTGRAFRPGDICLLSNQYHVSITFAMIDQVTSDTIRVSCDKALKRRYKGPFHLDKYTSMSTYSTTLGNLVYFLQNNEIGQRLRSVLVDLLPPRASGTAGINLPASIKKIIVKAKLNNEQRLAVVHALTTEDYMIIEGLPGSGKTTLISVLIQCLVSINKKVLLAAFTHSAVDNILAKLTKEVSPERILRLGSSSTIKDSIQKMTLKGKLQNESSEDYYRSVKLILKTTPIVACTCHHVPRELLFSYRHFDFVIVDEASMVLEPLLLPVLATSTRVILVGDCQQLTPLVVSRQAKSEGAGVSTMEKLQNAHPQAVVSLTSQYRMNKELSGLSSHLFYRNRLICGNEAVSRSSLDRTGDYTVQGVVEDHFKRALSGDISDSCAFIDTHSNINLPYQCRSGDGAGMINDGEAKTIVKLCTHFIKNGVKPNEIGVMSAYRKQVEHVRLLLKNDTLEVNTIDSYQGREKRVIIWSLTWTESFEKNTELLRDERRVNVALTRARQKLVVVGCKKSAESIPVLLKFCQLLTNYDSIPY